MTTDELRNKYFKYKRKLDNLYLILIILGIFAFAFMLSSMLILLFTVILPAIIIFTVQARNTNLILLETKNRLKEFIVLEKLENKFTDIKYIVDEGFDKDFISKCVSPVNYSAFKSYDYLSAKYNNIDFEYAYCELIIQSRRGRNVIFSGKVLQFIFDKSINGYVSISQPKIKDLIDGINEVKVENMAFDKEFTVYSDDPNQVFYILTPHFMEKLIKLNNIYKKEIKFYFYESKLVVSINDHKNFLSVNISESDKNYIETKKTIEELSDLVIDLILK